MSEASARSAVTLLVAALLLAGVALNAAAIARAKSARAADFLTSHIEGDRSWPSRNFR